MNVFDYREEGTSSLSAKSVQKMKSVRFLWKRSNSVKSRTHGKRSTLKWSILEHIKKCSNSNPSVFGHRKIERMLLGHLSKTCSIFEHFCKKKCSKLEHVQKLFLRVNNNHFLSPLKKCLTWENFTELDDPNFILINLKKTKKRIFKKDHERRRLGFPKKRKKTRETVKSTTYRLATFYYFFLDRHLI